MTNPVNTPTKNSNGSPSHGTPVAPAKAETVAEKSKINGTEPIVTEEQKPIEVSAQLQVIELKSANAVFDRLDEGLKMKEQFNKAKERVGEFEDFSKDYGDEGLVMTISNVGTNKNIQIQNVAMILDFVNNLVKTGKTHLKALETEIVNFTI
ncbi:hypothetical protein GCM10011514_10650 [Emticicia aquatilis]|uniref:Uncharacterized protein n=1 Tax=Emticicia aquatilis TaxID=1537369 RepID=A0A916YKD2_9BACT|nr:hypothetical protein [Emticicia aquatilis]GGD48466.1 hypothetical protein GCM10011514_10650 [Emticicia aquatilis]